ncbi:hypothetical protein RSAG8_06303, partial [Rhizoctonia solani AG-8 WAC10335]
MPRAERDQDETGAQNALSEGEIRKQMKQMKKEIRGFGNQIQFREVDLPLLDGMLVSPI